MFERIMRLIGPRASVTAIISKGNKILLEKRSQRIVIEGRKWCLPGGSIKYGEKAKNGIKREVREELGIKIKNPKFLFYQDEIIPRLRLHNVVLVFKVNLSGRIKSNWEVSKTEWFTQKEIGELDLAYNHRNLIKRFFKEKKSSK